MGLAGAARQHWSDRCDRSNRLARSARFDGFPRARGSDGCHRRARSARCNGFDRRNRSTRSAGFDRPARSAGGVSRHLVQFENVQHWRRGVFQRLELHLDRRFQSEPSARHQFWPMEFAGATRFHRRDGNARSDGRNRSARADGRDGIDWSYRGDRCNGTAGSYGSARFYGSHRSNRAARFARRAGSASKFPRHLFWFNDLCDGRRGVLQRLQLHLDCFE